ncbi:MAG: hypothetical protein IPJ50_01950, partial [Betaproteobacteria bacterium]|nr:hypothetical protein [Betaproteobacteria bacterium]
KFSLVRVSKYRYESTLFFIASISIWVALIYQIPYAILAYSLGAEEIRHGLNVLKEGVLPPTLWTTFSVVVSSFYVIFIVMFFYSLTNRMSRFYTISTFIGGALYVVSSICFTARDGALFYAMTLLFAFGLFREDLPANVRSRLSKILAISGALMLMFLIAFTIQRFFASGSSDDLLAGTLGYIGQQPFVFAETIVSQSVFYGFDLRFPLVSIIINGAETEVARTVHYEWSFGTFLKDYYSMFGWGSLVFLASAQTILFYSQFSKRFIPESFFMILLVAFYFQFMLSGVFYFRLGTRGGNLYMVLYALILLTVAIKSRGYVHRR